MQNKSKSEHRYRILCHVFDPNIRFKKEHHYDNSRVYAVHEHWNTFLSNDIVLHAFTKFYFFFKNCNILLTWYNKETFINLTTCLKF